MQKSKSQLKIQKFWPILFILAIWLAFSSPYFLKGKVPYASTYQVNFFAPWSHYEKFWGPVKNNAMPDVHTQIYPWKKFTIETLKSGQIPFWNPYAFSGNPHLANVQSAVLSPFNLLFFVVSFIDTWSIIVLLQPLLASLFMYLFLRSINASQLGSLVGSITFMFCGFMVVWMAYGTLAYAILYLPLALFAIEKYLQRRRLRFLLLLTLTIPFSFFSGHFQISIYFLLGATLYVLFKGFVAKNIYHTLYLVLSIIFGLVLSLPQLLPAIEFYRYSVRSELFQIGEAIPMQYLITVIAPDFFGNPVTRNDWFGHYAEWAGFIGIIPLTLAIYSIVRKKEATTWFFFLFGVFALVLAVQSPLSEAIIALKIPVISTSSLSRIIVLFSFAFAALATLGFDQLRKDLGDKSVGRGLTGLLIVIFVFFFGVWILLLFGHVLPDQWVIVAKRNLILPTVLFLSGVIMIFIARKNKRFLLFAICYLLFAISFDSLRFSQKWMPFDTRTLVYPNVPVIEGIREHIGDGRIFGNIGAEVTSYYGFPSIEGYDPLYIRRYGEFLRSAGSGKFLEAERSVAKLPRDAIYTDRVLDLLGVTLIFHPIADTNQGWAYPVWKDKKRYSLVYQDEKFQLFQNTMALPRAMLYYNFEIVKNEKDIINRFYSEDFDIRKKVILEEDSFLAPSPKGQGSAHITIYKPNIVTVKTTTDTPAILFLADNFYPGWKVFVNGHEERIYRADYTFRAVMVPSGESSVEFRYANWYFEAKLVNNF